MEIATTPRVLDEVHNVGDQKARGAAVRRIVGAKGVDDGLHPAGVVHMTGTLFRSAAARRSGPSATTA